jgi:hypothetical protein
MVSTSYQSLVVLLFTILTVCQAAFVPVEIQSRGASRVISNSKTELYMGLFDKKPPAKKAVKKGGSSFLDGRGARITIREDEDSAMWIEEPKDTKKQPPKKGK